MISLLFLYPDYPACSACPVKPVFSFVSPGPAPLNRVPFGCSSGVGGNRHTGVYPVKKWGLIVNRLSTPPQQNQSDLLLCSRWMVCLKFCLKVLRSHNGDVYDFMRFLLFPNMSFLKMHPGKKINKFYPFNKKCR